MNTLYYGDNLDILKRYIKDESVDLVYLDPPFNSNVNYNVLFAEKNGSGATAQIKAFDDTWHWDFSAAQAYTEVVEKGGNLSLVMQSFRTFLGENDMMAYLTMMAPRLIELQRALKKTGGIYLHCDPTASHYLKILLDAVFGSNNFRNEIIWHYGQRTDFYKGHFSSKHDVVLFYSKTAEHKINKISVAWKKEEFLKHRHDVIKHPDGKEFIYSDGGGEKGKRYLRPVEEVLLEGKPIDDVWDIPILNSAAKERLGYPTQKPEALLERIVKASTNENDIVLDPFCGCGTTISVAQKYKRNWIGIDITHLAISLMKHRLADSFGQDIEYEIIGEPADLSGAQELAQSDPYQFQWWALGLVGARPVEQKKGADKGIDGRLFFHDDNSGKTKQMIFSVKAGQVHSAHIRDLNGVLEREKAEMGVLISMEEPTRNMVKEASASDLYESEAVGKKFPKIQIITVGELLEGKKIEMPHHAAPATFKKAEKFIKKDAEEISAFDKEE
jgi:site-specific DNA-methyltransferase (adenine-specific)